MALLERDTPKLFIQEGIPFVLASTPSVKCPMLTLPEFKGIFLLSALRLI